MRVLVTGANGFIGSHIVARLINAGHSVIGCARNSEGLNRAQPGISRSIPVDFNRDLSPEDWYDRLDNVDAVINCVGVLQASYAQNIENIHFEAPKALFEACLKKGVRKVVQISAISADAGAGTAYADSKLRADRFLAKTDLDWVIVRPSLVVGRSAYGGTALMRAMAVLPWVIPIPGNGKQLFQPISMDDLCQTVETVVTDPSFRHCHIEPVGPDAMTLREILSKFRRWLGLGPALFLPVPLALVGLAARLGDIFGVGPLRTTSLRQMSFGNTGDYKAFSKKMDFEALTLDTFLAGNPAGLQDRQQAKLYFLAPLVRVTLALIWISSAYLGLACSPIVCRGYLSSTGFTAEFADAIIMAGSLVDLAIGAAVLTGFAIRTTGWIQIIMIVGYTVALTVLNPGLWGEPLGPLLKNAAILALVPIWIILESRR